MALNTKAFGVNLQDYAETLTTQEPCQGFKPWQGLMQPKRPSSAGCDLSDDRRAECGEVADLGFAFGLVREESESGLVFGA